VPDVYKQLLRNCACCRAVRSGVGSRGSRAVLSRDEPGRKGETRLSPSKVFTIFPTLAVICLMMLAPSHTDAADKLGRYVGGCEFSRSSNPLYYMRKLDFPARVAQTSHEVMSG
jgi:hypothetical protein